MKLLVEVDVEPSADNPNVTLNAELVTRRYQRYLQNATVSELRLVYTDTETGKPVTFIATIKGYQAVEPV